MIETTSKNEMLKIVSLNVHYELAMLGNTLNALLNCNLRIDISQEEKVIRNALLHSFLISARNLCHFLYSYDPRKNDIIAEHFFDDPEDWRRLRPKPLPEFSDGSFVTMVSRRLLHLTYERSKGTQPLWTSFVIAWEIVKPFEVFVDKVCTSRLSDLLVKDTIKFANEMRLTIDEFGSVEDVESIPLFTLWEDAGFWTEPRRI